MLTRLGSLLRNLTRRADVERDLADEVTSYLDLLTDEKIRQGMSPDEARRAARVEMGTRDSIVENVRGSRAGARIERVLRDARLAVRALARAPGFAAVTLGTLALGIGGIAVVFAVAQALLLQPLPYHEPDRLVSVAETRLDRPGEPGIVAAPNFLDWQERTRSFERMALYEYLSFNLAGDGGAESVDGLRATSGLFATLGIPAMLGRTFLPEEDTPGTYVAVLSEGLWQQRYGADSSILGRSIRINGQAHEVVGVMPRTFLFPSRRQALWVPMNFNEEDAGRSSHSFHAFARLKDGVSAAQADAEMRAIGDALRAEHPAANANESATAFPMRDLWTTGARETLGLLVAAVAFVLLIACVNVASLLLARGVSRRHELAVRAAIGGTRRRIIAQLVTESVVVSVLGAAAALMVAVVVLPLLVRAFPTTLSAVPFRDITAVQISPAVFGTVTAISLIIGIACGLIPALRFLPGGTSLVHNDLGVRATAGRGGRFAQNAFVAFEVGMALIVLVSAGLLTQSVRRAFDVDPGFDPRDVAAFRLPLPQSDFYGEPTREQFCADVARLVDPVPGVVSSGAVSHVPLGGANAGRGFVIAGRQAPAPGEQPGASYAVTCPGFFGTMHIPIVAGRDFNDRDGLSAPRVAVVNEALVRQYFPDGGAIGERISLSGSGANAVWHTIVGVVGDVRHSGLTSDVAPFLYRPYSQTVWPAMHVVVRGRIGATLPVHGVRTALRSLSPDQPIGDAVLMTTVVEQSLGHLRFPTLMVSAFALIAVALSTAGIFGVASQAVIRRTREFGIRTAIGASPVSLFRLVLTQTLKPVALGLAVGVAGSLIVTRLLEGLLFGVTRTDAGTYVVVGALLTAAALVASALPALRAARMDPLLALRHE